MYITCNVCFFLQTTIMAIEFEGGVIIGADSRTTTGYVHVDHIMSYCATDLDSKRLNYSSYELMIRILSLS